jgi:hypothetical protein
MQFPGLVSYKEFMHNAGLYGKEISADIVADGIMIDAGTLDNDFWKRYESRYAGNAAAWLQLMQCVNLPGRTFSIYDLRQKNKAERACEQEHERQCFIEQWGVVPEETLSGKLLIAFYRRCAKLMEGRKNDVLIDDMSIVFDAETLLLLQQFVEGNSTPQAIDHFFKHVLCDDMRSKMKFYDSWLMQKVNETEFRLALLKGFDHNKLKKELISFLKYIQKREHPLILSIPFSSNKEDVHEESFSAEVDSVLNSCITLVTNDNRNAHFSGIHIKASGTLSQQDA